MRVPPLRPVVACCALGLLAGCPSVQSVQTAKTAGAGNIEVGIEPGIIGAAGAGGEGGFLPTVNLSVRGGVSDRVDIGGRFGSSLIELHTKVMFTDPNEEGIVQAAFAPQLGGIFLGGGGGVGGYGWLTLPVLFDIPAGPHAFVLGPRVQTIFLGGSALEGGGSVALFNAGSSVAFAARVSDRVRLIPELAIVGVVAGGARANGQGAAGLIGRGALYTFNLGVVVGGR